MNVAETERLVMKTNLRLNNGNIIYVDKKIDLSIESMLNTKSTETEDAGFGFYLKEYPTKQICHIGTRNDRRTNEITYGTEEGYRNNGYMREALKAALEWLFQENGVSELYGLIYENDSSERIIIENGFQIEGVNGKEKWYVHTRELYKKNVLGRQRY